MGSDVTWRININDAPLRAVIAGVHARDRLRWVGIVAPNRHIAVDSCDDGQPLNIHHCIFAGEIQFATAAANRFAFERFALSATQLLPQLHQVCAGAGAGNQHVNILELCAETIRDGLGIAAAAQHLHVRAGIHGGVAFGALVTQRSDEIESRH